MKSNCDIITHNFNFPNGTPLEALFNFIGQLLTAHNISHNIQIVPGLQLDHPIEESKLLLTKEATTLNERLTGIKLLYSSIELTTFKQGPNFVHFGFACHGAINHETLLHS